MMSLRSSHEDDLQASSSSESCPLWGFLSKPKQ
jgi:hypothetical protein